MIDLKRLTEPELRKLEAALRSLPPGTPLDRVDWAAVREARRTGPASVATVGHVMKEIAALRSGRSAIDEMNRRLDAIAARMRQSPDWREPQRREIDATLADLRALVDECKAWDRWAAEMLLLYGDHRTDPMARPWPPYKRTPNVH